MSDPDYYQTLGVARDASNDEIKRAYRALARELHPDRNPGDAHAEARFKQVARAYEVLSDPEKRARFDRFGSADSGAGDPFGGGLGDIFSAFFGGGSPFGGGGGRASSRATGEDLEVVLDLDLVDAVTGGGQAVTVRTAQPCDTCEATGAKPGTAAQTCGECRGTGQVRRIRESILGQMVSASPCGVCRGAGQVIPDPCPDCMGQGRQILEKEYTVDVPAGVDTGSTLRLPGRGAAGVRGGGFGDLYVHVRVKPHPDFERDGDDLVRVVKLSIAQASLGCEIDIVTIEGGVEMIEFPAGVQSSTLFRVRGGGAPRLKGRGRGDLVIEAVVETPRDLTDEQEALLRQLAELRGEAVAAPEQGMLSRLRSAFR